MKQEILNDKTRSKSLKAGLVLSLIIILLIALGANPWHIRHKLKKSDVEIALCKPGNLWYFYYPESDSIFFRANELCHFDEDSVTYALNFLKYKSKDGISRECWQFKRSSMELIMPRNGWTESDMKLKVIRVDHNTIYMTQIDNSRVIMINWTDGGSDKGLFGDKFKTDWAPLPLIEVPEDDEITNDNPNIIY